MTTDAARAQEIVQIVADTNDFKILEPARIGEGDWKNEFVFFIKPEAFMVDSPEYSTKIVDLVFQKMREFDAQVDGIAVVSGSVLDRLAIMSSHYGMINRLSNAASTMFSDEDREKIAASLGQSIEGAEILGGHEFLRAFPNLSPVELDKIWFEERSGRVRSGTYVRLVNHENRKIVLVNGFHPEQLRHFTESSHRIVLMLIHSNNSWATLKNEMVGATFPDKASPGSIRGTLYANAADYGFESVTIANNVTHLSAGPFEGFFEINNFFGKIMGVDARERQPLILRKMGAQGLSVEQGLAALENPIVSNDPKPTDLFSATEELDTDAAVEVWKKYQGK